MRIRCHALLVLSVLGAGAARAQDPSQAGAPFPDGPLMQAASQGGEQPGPPAGSDGQLAQPAQPGQQAQQTQQSPQQTADAAAAARRDALRLDHSGPYERFWFRGGPLLWWIKDAPAPGPLVTTSSPASGGALTAPDTVTLFGNDNIDFKRFFGMKFEGGAWFNCQHTWGFELGGFLLEQRSQSTSFASNAAGSPVLARPVVNVVTILNVAGVAPGPVGVVIATPANPATGGGPVVGSIGVSTKSQFGGAEANFDRNLCHGDCWNVDLLFGFRYLDLEEDLNVASQSNSPGGGLLFGGAALPPGSTVGVADRFLTRNQFYGGQLGARAEWWRGAFFVSALGKVALGPNHETITVAGVTTATTPGGAVSALPGGLLALPGANIGRRTDNWFVVAPEVGLSVGMQVTDHLRASVGYSYLYINEVARPGSQVNLNINPSLAPTSLVFGSVAGVPAPAPSSRQENFFAHGLQMELEVRY